METEKPRASPSAPGTKSACRRLLAPLLVVTYLLAHDVGGQEPTPRSADSRSLVARSEVLLVHEQGRIYAVDLDAEDHRIALALVSGEKGDIRVYKLDSSVDPTAALVLEASYYHDKRIRALSLSADGTRLAMGGERGELLVWDLETKAPSEILAHPSSSGHAHDSTVNWVAFGPRPVLSGENGSLSESRDELWLASASRDGTAKLWRVGPHDLEWAATLKHSRAHGVNTAVFDASGEDLLTASGDGLAKRWRVADGSPVGKPLRHDGSAFLAAVFVDSREKRRIATGGDDGIVRLWDSSLGEELERFTRGARINGLAMLEEQNLLLSIDQAGRLGFWNVETGELEGEITPHDGPIYDLAAHSSGDRLLTVGEDGRLVLHVLEGRQGPDG